MNLPSAQDVLPVATVLDEILVAARRGAVVVTAPPGSGKTTLVPAALLDDQVRGQVVLVQPRRLAARAVARRLATLRQSKVGQEVGYHVRFDRQASEATRLLVVTTGMLLRRMLDDESLEGVGAVVLDEFHERSIEMDLALGMLCRVRETLRPDLRLAVMSATLDAAPVARLLGDCQVVHAQGRAYPVEVRYAAPPPGRASSDALATERVMAVAGASQGHVLVFLPGVGEIVRCRQGLQGWADKQGMVLAPLYGDLSPQEQDRAIAPSNAKKIILATNVAETSITIDGVATVVDSGLARKMQFNAELGLPRLELAPISQASADQRAGRAGRTGPGVCWRLWEARSHRHRPEFDVPEIVRADLSETLLRLRLWGERDLQSFPWLDAPSDEAIDAAERLLQLLGALDDAGEPTACGIALARLPAHPRLARLLMAGAASGTLYQACLAAALLSERDPFSGRDGSNSLREQITARVHSDLGERVTALQFWHQHRREPANLPGFHRGAAQRVLQAAEQLRRESPFTEASASDDPDEALRRDLLYAFPDRLARSRPGSEDRGLLAGGKGVRLTPPSRVRGESFFLAIDLQDAASEARCRLASAVEREWLVGDLVRVADEMFYNPSRKQVEARRRTYWLDLLVDETPIAVDDPVAAAKALARHAAPELERLLPDEKDAATRFRHRVQWLASVAPESGRATLSSEELVAALPQWCVGKRSLAELETLPWLSLFHQLVGYERLADIDRLAPEAYVTPNGKRRLLKYEPGRPPVLSVRIQEMFGVAQTPRVADGKVKLLLHLLGPNFRPQQVTDDLESFWKTTYAEVKKELKRRYPKHAWPDDPLSRP